jgi:3D (Asp-Asp-Asp) domain-containing protein
MFGTLALSASAGIGLLLDPNLGALLGGFRRDSASLERFNGPRDSGYRVFVATAYCLQGVTRSGVQVKRGIVAADPSRIPLGSVIQVRAGSYSGIYRVLDTGSAIKGRVIDIYVPDYNEAMRFGRQRVQVRVLRHGWDREIPTVAARGKSRHGIRPPLHRARTASDPLNNRVLPRRLL